MNILELQLAQLENRMMDIRNLRAQRLLAAGELIKTANLQYDAAAIPLARQINKLRAQLEVEKPKPEKSVSLRSDSHDPEWSQEDIDHYYELRQRGNKKSVTTNR